MKKTLIASALACAVCSIASGASETAPVIGFDMSIGQHTSSWQDAFGTAIADSTLWSYGGSMSNAGGSLEYSLYADPDPVLGFDFSFWNTSEETQAFSVVVTLPVAVWANATTIGASIGGSVTDANSDGDALLSSISNGPVFNGLIDGAAWLPLFEGISVTAPYAGGTTIISDVDGLPGPSKPGPLGVDFTISITLDFNLTPGDRASFTGVFIVEYVPAPSAALLLVGGALLGRRRRN